MEALQFFRPIPEGEHVLRVSTLRLLRLAGIYAAIAAFGVVAAGVATLVAQGGVPATVLGTLLGLVPLLPFARLAARTPFDSPFIAARAARARRATHPEPDAFSFLVTPATLAFVVLVLWWANSGPSSFRTGATVGFAASAVVMGGYRFLARRAARRAFHEHIHIIRTIEHDRTNDD
jgi:hypothetical protein